MTSILSRPQCVKVHKNKVWLSLYLRCPSTSRCQIISRYNTEFKDRDKEIHLDNDNFKCIFFGHIDIIKKHY